MSPGSDKGLPPLSLHAPSTTIARATAARGSRKDGVIIVSELGRLAAATLPYASTMALPKTLNKKYLYVYCGVKQRSTVYKVAQELSVGSETVSMNVRRSTNMKIAATKLVSEASETLVMSVQRSTSILIGATNCCRYPRCLRGPY